MIEPTKWEKDVTHRGGGAYRLLVENPEKRGPLESLMRSWGRYG